MEGRSTKGGDGHNGHRVTNELSSPKFEMGLAAKFGEEYNAARVRGSDGL